MWFDKRRAKSVIEGLNSNATSQQVTGSGQRGGLKVLSAFVAAAVFRLFRSRCFMSAGAEAKAFVASGAAFGWAVTGASGLGGSAIDVSGAAAAWFDCRSATQNYRHGQAGRLLSRPWPELWWQSRRRVSDCCRELQGVCQKSLSLSFAVPVSGVTGPISGRSVGFEREGAASDGPEGSATGTRLLI